jgi:hypothetical protein
MRSGLLPRLPVFITVLALGLLGSALPAHAILFYATGDTNYNTTPPTGVLTNSGWQFQGRWGNFLGTPIGPRHFITAKHLGGFKVGDPFWFAGIRFDTTAAFPDPQSDLQIWRVCGPLPRFAPLHSDTNEVGQALVVFGRGTQRGGPVTTSGASGTKTNGWQWGARDYVTRWGSNAVSAIFQDPTMGEMLQAEFNANAGPDECHLSTGDSGGAVFIQKGGTWELAGINYSVDGPYSTTNSGTGFNAALFDQGGLYVQDGTNWVWTPDRPREQPGTFYASRISSHLAWINGILAQPIPDAERVVLQFADDIAGAYADDLTAVADEVSGTITVPVPATPRFYRLRACLTLRITAIVPQGPNIILRFATVPAG